MVDSIIQKVFSPPSCMESVCVFLPLINGLSYEQISPHICSALGRVCIGHKVHAAAAAA